MSFKSWVNVYRRKLTHSLTHNMGKRSIEEMQKKAHFLEVKRVLISRPNHRLGNMLLITPLVQEVIDTFPDCKIDLFVKGKITPIIFENYPQIDRIIELPKKPFKEFGKYIKVWFSLRKHKYDLVINVEKASSSGRISAIVAKADFKFFGDDFEELNVKYADFSHIAKYPIYNFRRFLEILIQKSSNKEVPLVDLKLSEKEIAIGKQKLDDLTKDSSRETLAFFTYATGTKCYPIEWWTEFYQQFHPKFIDKYNLIEVLPVENISQLERKLPTFYSKDIREIGALMANCKVVVAADSGMMHLGSSALTITFGLFSVSSIEKYAPYGNQNTFFNTNIQSQLEIVQEMEKKLM